MKKLKIFTTDHKKAYNISTHSLNASHKAFNEYYQFDRLSHHISNIAEARWDYINDRMAPIPDDVIGY